MVRILPQTTDTLNNPSHSFLHRVVSVDTDSPESSIDVGATGLVTLRIAKRVVTAPDATSITPNADTSDAIQQTNTQAAGTLTVNAPTGTPTDFQQLQIKISSTNAQTFSWNAGYRATTDVALPTTIGAGKEVEFGFEYHATATKWDLIALTNII